MNDTGLILQVYDKLGKLVAESDAGSTKVDVQLPKGNSFQKGDLQVAFTDGVNTSPLVDVPAFTAGSAGASSSSHS